MAKPKLWIPPLDDPSSVPEPSPAPLIIGEDLTFVCSHPGCSLRFTRLRSLVQHSLKHSNNPKPFRCDIPGCGSSYGSNAHLKRHKKQVHSSEDKDFKCTNDPGNCIASFRTLLSLQNHINRAHFPNPKPNYILAEPSSQIKKEKPKPKPYICKVCNNDDNGTFTIGFTSRNSFLQHLRTSEHEENVRKSLVCAHPNCGQTFSSKSSFNAHQKTHLEVRSIYKCPHEPCVRTYYHLKNLNFHIKSSHSQDNIYTCDVCSKKLSTKQKLAEHLQRIHEPKPDKEEITKNRKYKLRRKKLAQCFAISKNEPIEIRIGLDES